LGIWSTASNLAAKTPPERNRYVDFLRAASILVVVTGHWLIATAWYVDGQLTPGHLLKSHPQYQWLTWLFQVMPIFFIVGGYSNGVSLESALRKGQGYADWLVARLHRLVTPLLLLIVTWGVVAGVMKITGVRSEVIVFTSQAALIPTWFLSIYITLVLLAPFAYRLWRRFGFVSFWAFVALAAIVDALFFGADIRWPGWTNYFWYLLIHHGPYPLAMVSSPDKDVSNTLPPKITLLALGVFQFGLLLALEGPMRRALDNLKLWTATVLINSMIMTVYLWHITIMVLVGSAMYLADGFGFGIEPGTQAWWLTRPLWIGVLAIVLVPVAMWLSALERRGRSPDAPVPSAGRQVTGAIMVCLGIALLAMWGFGGAPIKGFGVGAFALVIGGAFLSGLLSLRKSG
jgi:peptidoglycan/LPS O-acetylase OafA/YrhL